MALEFALNFKRQYKGPLDIDIVFLTETALTSYLTSSNRYAGQIVGCVETELVYILNSTETAWKTVGGMQNVVEDTTPQSGGNFDMNSHRLLESKGASVVSANNLTLGNDGNSFIISGSTQLNLLNSTGWSEGSEIALQFTGTPVIKHNQTTSGLNYPIFLNLKADYTAKANDILVLKLIDGIWYEINALTKVSGLQNVVEDTTPQAGGDFDMNSHRFLESKGASVVSANNLTLGNDGNAFVISGSTQLNLLNSVDWSEGSEITLQFSGTPVIKHNQTLSGLNYPIFLNLKADYTAKANDILVLKLIDGIWYEINALTKLSSVPSPYIYVDSVNGDDTLAGYSFPFKTLDNAIIFAPAGSTIWVKGGSYTPSSILGKENVNWKFENYPTIIPTDSCPYLWVVSESVTNHHASNHPTGFKITGNVNIVLPDTSICIPYYVNNPSFEIIFEYNSIVSNIPNSIPVFINSNNNVILKHTGITTAKQTLAIDIVGNGIFDINGYSIYSVNSGGTKDNTIVSLGINRISGSSGINQIKYNSISNCLAYFKANFYFEFANAINLELIDLSGSGTINGTCTTLTVGNSSLNGFINYVGKINTLNINGGTFTAHTDLSILNQTSGILYLYGSVTTTFNKTGGTFYGNVSISSNKEYHSVGSTDFIVIGDQSVITPASKLNLTSSASLDGLEIYNSAGNELFRFTKLGAMKIAESSNVPSAITNYTQLFVDIIGKLKSINDAGVIHWLNGILDMSPNVGDTLVFNGTTGFTNQPTTEFDLILQKYELNIISNGLIITTIPAGYSIYSIFAEEINNNSAGIIRIGTSANANNIVTDTSVPSLFDGNLLVSNTYFSKSTDTPVYVTSTAFGSGIVNLYFTFIKTR